MSHERKALVFDVDPESMGSIAEALPGWKIDAVYGATIGSLPSDWDPGTVDLFIVGPREDVSETLGLCRFLSYCRPFSREFHRDGVDSLGLRGGPASPLRRPDATLLVLVPPARADLVSAALRAGAHSCLVLPINAKDVASVLVRARAGNRPGRHTLNLEHAQRVDRWRDDGGQG